MSRLLCVVFLLDLLVQIAPPFSQNQVVGTWELVSQTRDGKYLVEVCA